MSLLTRIIMEAERASAWEFIREEGLRAAMQAAARQADLRVRTNRPAGPGEAGPVRVGGASPTRAGSSKQVCSSSPTGAGTPISNNSPGRPDVRVVGRSPQPTKPIQSVKSKIVPEPDQIQSAPPTRREIPEH
jgi:hypothetical protein